MAADEVVEPHRRHGRRPGRYSTDLVSNEHEPLAVKYPQQEVGPFGLRPGDRPEVYFCFDFDPADVRTMNEARKAMTGVLLRRIMTAGPPIIWKYGRKE